MTIDVEDGHLPLFLRRRTLTLARAEPVVVASPGPIGAFTMRLNGVAVAGFPELPVPRPPGARFGGLPAVRADAALAAGIRGRHRLAVTGFGGLGTGGANPVGDEDRLRDLVLVVDYTA